METGGTGVPGRKVGKAGPGSIGLEGRGRSALPARAATDRSRVDVTLLILVVALLCGRTPDLALAAVCAFERSVYVEPGQFTVGVDVSELVLVRPDRTWMAHLLPGRQPLDAQGFPELLFRGFGTG